ncbi:MAG TPA: hypothetical protein VMT43_05690 [Acidimicrobiales bacterium]|nr:hypothetical protein [Acidimicrobiales bacterium]
MSGPVDPTRPVDDPDDAAALAGYAEALASQMVTAIPGWVRRVMVGRLVAFHGAVTDDQLAVVEAAGLAVVADAGPTLRELLARDIDAQASTPLEVVRAQVHHPTDALRLLGVPPAARDAFDAQQFPEDVYDLGPRSYVDIDPALEEPALTWGAAKAHVHLRRRRRGDRV